MLFGENVMFQIKLYKCISDINVVDKVLSDEMLFDGYSRNPINILSPEIIIEGMDINNYNYAYIPFLKRYYYITDITLVHANCYQIQLRVDVLKTYETDIKRSKGLITCQENFNPYSGEYEIESRNEIEKINFKNPFNENGSIILVTLRN